MSAGPTPLTPFHDLADFVAMPRVTALRLAPDGTWLAAAVQTLSADRKKYLTSIWRIDAKGGPARRLTRSAEGEGSPRFLPDGSLLFTSRRADPAGQQPDGDSGDVAALWLLPAAGGEARVVAALPGGITAAEVARDAGGIVVGSPVLPAAGNGDDTRLRAGAQGRRDHRHPARVRAGPVLGSRPRARPAPAVRRRPRPGAGNGDRLGRRGQGIHAGRRHRGGPGRGRTGGAARPATGPDARAGTGARRGGVRADPGRHLGRDRMVAVEPGGRVALRAGHDRRGQRQAAGAAQRARVRLLQPAGLARRAVHRLPARAARHRRPASGPHPGHARHWRLGPWRWLGHGRRDRPRPAARLGPVAAGAGLVARLPRAVLRRRRRRPGGRCSAWTPTPARSPG